MDVDEGFTSYVSQRRLKLFRAACLLCGDPHQAEDIVQEALARLYAAWPRVSRADNIDAYAGRSSTATSTRRAGRGVVST
jgi:DNA-directed RNA polymerase specialized sigma24 family protein